MDVHIFRTSEGSTGSIDQGASALLFGDRLAAIPLAVAPAPLLGGHWQGLPSAILLPHGHQPSLGVLPGFPPDQVPGIRPSPCDHLGVNLTRAQPT